MILVICAPSGTGKTTLINRLISESSRYEFSISTTTRQIRPGEVRGESYYYVEKNHFLDLIDNDEFLEWAEVHGNYYGSTKKEVDRILEKGKIPVFDIDIQGSQLLKKQLGHAVYIFIAPPSFMELRERLIGRKSDSEEQVELRLSNAKKEMLEYSNFDYVVINNELDEAYRKLLSIVEAESCKTEKVEERLKTILEDFDDYTIG